MQTGTTIAVALSSASFASYGLSCLLSSRMVREFERYGLGRFRTITGVLQIAASLGLVAGAILPRLRLLIVLSAAGLAAMMFLAVLVRLRIRDPWPAALPAFGFFCLNLYIAAAASWTPTLIRTGE